jgi:SAM-dependent methyltransferase
VARLIAFLRRPHIPWLVLEWLANRWPRAYHILRSGTSNPNTQKHWDEAWGRHGANGYRAALELVEVRHWILEHVPAGAEVLEVGCGTGEMMALLRETRDCRCSGVDISPAAIAKVTAMGFNARSAAVPPIPFETSTFDVVVCTEVLEHITNDKGTASEIRRVLRPDGMALITVPDGSTDREELHIHRYTAARLRKLLSSNAFTVVTIETIEDPTTRTFVVVAAAE